jgi:hypothetical protein
VFIELSLLVCVCLVCVYLSRRLYIYIHIFCGDLCFLFAGSSHPGEGFGSDVVGRVGGGGCSEPSRSSGV